MKLRKLLMGLAILFGAHYAIAQNKAMTFEQLPAQAQTFVKTYFSADNVTKVKPDYDKNGEMKEYDVYFQDGTKVEFHLDGNWKEVRVKVGEVPAKLVLPEISQYIQTNYPNNVVKEIKRRNYGYKVEITNKLNLKFSADGTFLRIDD